MAVDDAVRGLKEAGMEALIQTCAREARNIRSTVAQISTSLGNTWWKGDDADRFRENWQGRYRQENLAVAEELEALARHLRDQLERQRRASRG